jgi:hypothetical protein
MKIESVDVIPYSRDLVFSTLRDKLVEMVPYLPNIKTIEEKEREDLGDGSTRVFNWWKAKSEIPKVARAIVKPEMLHWNDHAIWNEKSWTVDWRLETNFFTDRVNCEGRNVYRALDDDRTELAIHGELTIDVKNIKGVPRIMAGTIGSGIEKFVVTLIAPNFKTLNKGLIKYLASKEKKS